MDLLRLTLGLLIPVGFVVLGTREYNRGHTVIGSYMLVGGIGIMAVIIVQLIFG